MTDMTVTKLEPVLQLKVAVAVTVPVTCAVNGADSTRNGAPRAMLVRSNVKDGTCAGIVVLVVLVVLVVGGGSSGTHATPINPNNPATANTPPTRTRLNTRININRSPKDHVPHGTPSVWRGCHHARLERNPPWRRWATFLSRSICSQRGLSHIASATRGHLVHRCGLGPRALQ